MGIDLALLDDPRLRPSNDAFRRPPWKRTTLEDESRGEKCPSRCQIARDDIARDDVRGVGIWVPQKVSQGDDRPRIAAGRCR